MSQKKEFLILTICFILTLALTAGIGLWLKNSFFTNNSNGNNSQVNNFQIKNLNEVISEGNKLLVFTNTNPNKQQGINALNEQNYSEAINQFQTSLKTNSNDPETLIYLNNARIGKDKFYGIGIGASITTDIDGSQEILRGVAQLQNEINKKGGINGTPIKIIIADDQNNPEIAKKIAENFTKNSNILAVIGHWASDITLATAPIYESAKLVAISPISTSVQLSSFGKYIYRTVPSDRFAGSALSRYQINQLNKKKTAIFYSSKSNYSKSLKDEFTTALFADGGEIVAEIDLTEVNFNAGKSVPEVISQGAEVLMIATTTSTLDQTLQIIQANDGKLPILAGDDGYNIKILEIGGKDAEGMIVAIPWHILANTNTQFVKDSRNLWAGADVNWRTVTAYDALSALISAIKENPTRQGIQEALSDSKFQAEGATSPVKFLPSGDRNEAIQLVKVAKTNNPNFPYQFIPVNSK